MSATSSKDSREQARVALCVVTILLLGSIIYSNSLQGPFVLDDKSGIERNPAIRHLWPPEWLRVHRPLAVLTLAMNYSAHGLSVRGYHVVNTLIHLAAGLALFGIVRQTLSLGDLRERYSHSRDWLALGTALIWLAHPLQTQSVTYVIQRMESLMGLFYLLTVLGFIRAQQAGKPILFYAASVMACALGMATKEVMVTAPLMVLTFDRVYVADSWRQILQARRRYYAALFATWIVMGFVGPWSGLSAAILPQESPASPSVTDIHAAVPAVTAASRAAASSSAEHEPPPPLTPLSYALSQPGVICHYLKRTVIPTGLCLDLWWPIATTPSEIIPPAILVVTLLIVTLRALFKYPRWGFPGWWFFLILAPTSTVVPIKDLAFEHRMYLSLAGPVVLFVIGGYELLRRWKLTSAGIWLYGCVPIVVLILSALTYQRNEDYRSAEAVWTDVVAGAPHNPRALNNYGLFLDSAGRSAEALQYFSKVLRVAPYYDQTSDVHLNIANIYHRRKDFDRAEAGYLRALEANPGNPRAVSNLGVLMAGTGRTEAALALFEKAIRLSPRSAEYHTNLGVALATLGRRDEALEQFRRALALDPRFEHAKEMLRRTQQPTDSRRNRTP